ncbi:MAG: protein-disulfide reductase DsbD family protein, partial [Alphaproteobacteria bacterium]
RASLSKFAPLIENFQRRVPTPPNRNFLMTDITADAENIYVKAKARTFFWEPDIFIESNKPALLFDVPDVEMAGKKALFTIPYEKITDADAVDFNVWDELLTFTVVDNGHSIEQQRTPQFGTLPSAQNIEEESGENGSLKLYLWMIFVALLGGFVLNFMPCVLPVLSLKALHFVNDKEHSVPIIRMNLLATAAGIIVTFFTFATIAIAIQSTGGVLGWGMQFQSTGFLLFMIAVLLLFSLNIFGLYTIPVPTKLAIKIDEFNQQFGFEGASVISSFFSGILVTILATPCTAPFLGSALGFALSRTALDIYLIFILLGIGLALPYIILSVFPQAMHFLPKPGKWMVYFKNTLGIFLVLTAAWLLSVLILGRETIHGQSIEWEVFDEARIETLVSTGKTVFVNVTADWCITCKYNKKFVLNTPEIATVFESYDIIAMQADWTRRDPRIGAYLKKFNRYGVPFNAIYSPSAEAPLILSELLTKKSVARALTKDIIEINQALSLEFQ